MKNAGKESFGNFVANVLWPTDQQFDFR